MDLILMMVTGMFLGIMLTAITLWFILERQARMGDKARAAELERRRQLRMDQGKPRPHVSDQGDVW